MEMLPPAGVPELATKADLDVLRAEVAAVEARVGERLERAIRQQTNRFIGWMLAAFGLVVTANGLVTALA